MKCEREGCVNVVAKGPGRTGKYCSRSCAAIVNNAKRKVAYKCIVCDKVVSSSRSIYCSNTCRASYDLKIRINNWLSGENMSDASGELFSNLRTWLLDSVGNKCTQCGWSVPNPVTQKVTLTIDHIDGDARNNRYNNLRVLCYNCHTLTPTFNALNRGNGTRRYAPGTRR